MRFLRFSRKRQDESVPIFFFQGLGENTCSLQPALKRNVPGLKAPFYSCSWPLGWCYPLL